LVDELSLALSRLARKGTTMTQAQLEQIAREMRAKGLHSSWSDLIEFSDCVVGGLVDAYQALLRDSASSDRVPSTNTSDLHTMVQEKLVRALTSLTSQAQVARWESEVLGNDYTVHGRETPI